MNNTPDQQPSLIEFPCRFSIKAMGENVPEFADAMLQTVRPFAPEITPKDIVLRLSSAQKYVGATITIDAQNQAQLDDIYRALTSHALIKAVY